ncbi:MAG: branched-chain amino acid ABC transporter permease [Candidatus Caldatribacteriota bacterium]|nr:branched-chain amino acid ABC transporter permease [Candidatus Caldatribacteriota bacterium]
MLNNKKVNIFLLIIAIVLFIFLPRFLSGYWVRVITTIFMYAVIAQGMNIMSGYMGYLPFGNAMFFGIGAYVTAIGMSKGLSFLVVVPLAVITAILFSVLLGIPVLRLRGHYFAIATIGMSAAILSVVQNATEITGGAMGTTLPIINKAPGVVYNYFYLAMFGLMIITTLSLYFIIKSKFGFGIRSIKANEEAANSMGINTTYHKVVAWAISALFTSIAGALYAYWMSFIAPDEVFDVMIAVNTIVIMLIGGAGSILGPIIGAFIIELFAEIAWSSFLEYHLAVLGIIIIVIVFFVPKGVTGTFGDFVKKRKLRVGKKVSI